MKKSALLLAGVMTASIAIVPLAACSAPKGSEFKVENYAKPIAEYTQLYQLPEGLTIKNINTLNYRVSSISGSKRLMKSHDSNSGKVQLFDSKTDSVINSNWYDNIEAVSSWYANGESLVYRLTTNGDVTRNQFCGPDGVLLTSDYVYLPYEWEYQLFTTEQHKVAGEKDYVTVYVFKYFTADSNGYQMGEKNTKYFTYLENRDGEYVWKEVSENDLDPSNGEYAIGKEVGVVKSPISLFMQVKEKDFPNYPYFNYSLSYEGSGLEADTVSGTFTFWRDGENKGSVSIENGNVLAIAGENAFFYEIAPVSADAKSGYNYEEVSDGATVKANYTLYSYNFVNGGKAKKVKTDYVILETADRLYYNHSENLFDMWSVSGAYKMVKGVAVVNDYSKEYNLMLDSKGHVSVDLSDKPLGSDFYKLSTDRYLSGNAIVDAKLNTVSLFATAPALWKSAELLCIPTMEGTAYVGFDSRVAIAPVASSGTTYYFSDAMVARVDGELKVYSKMNPYGALVSDLINYDKVNDSMSYYASSGLNLIVKRVSDGNDNYTFTLYNYSGSQIGSTLTGSNLSTFIKVGQKAYAVLLNNGSYSTIVLS